MNRREFLKALGIGGAALAVPKFAYAQNPIQYPLTSRPDLDTQLDEQSAAKARKVAEYVITKSKQSGLLQFNPNHRIGDNYQGVQAVMEIGDWRYTVWVANHNKNAQLEMHDHDLLSVWMRPKGTSGQDKLISFSDEGLDGRCDFGIIGKGLSNNGQTVLYRAKERASPNGENLQHRERFQKLYSETLDNLVKFYERK